MSHPPFPCAAFSEKLLEYIQTVVFPSRPLEVRFKQNCLDELANKEGWREERRALKKEVDDVQKGYDEMKGYIDVLFQQHPYLKLEKDLRLQESYETQVSRYRALGWLVERDGKEGIIGLDMKFYPLPSLEEVREVLSEKAELLNYKYSQGFTQFMLEIGRAHV